MIGHWNAVAMGVLTQSPRPLLTQPFVVAAMHVAIYNAVVAIEGGVRPYATAVAAPRGASPAAAAAAAAHAVLVGFLPGNAAAAATLADRLDDGSQSARSHR